MKSLIILVFWLQSTFGATIKGSFPPPKDLYIPILDTYSFDLDGDGTDEILATSLNTRDRKAPGPIAVYKYKGEGKYVDASLLFFLKIPKFFHARHVLFIPNFKPHLPALFISDHGVDFPPFTGGVSRLFLWNQGLKKFVDKTEKYGLADYRAFTFSSTFTRLKNGDVTIFKSNILLPISGPEFLELNQSKRYENTIAKLDKFPRNKCFMNALFADFDKDGADELFLGGCDMGQWQENFLESDLVMKLDHGKVKPWLTLPKRNDESLWGVGAVYAQSLFSNSKKNLLLDLVTVIYNPTFSRGKLNLYQNTGTDLKLVGQYSPTKLKQDFFIPWVTILDLNGDGLAEIIGTFRSGGQGLNSDNFSKYFVLINNGVKFHESAVELDLPKKEVFINVLKLKINGIDHLAFPTYNGTLYILDRLPLK